MYNNSAKYEIINCAERRTDISRKHQLDAHSSTFHVNQTPNDCDHVIKSDVDSRVPLSLTRQRLSKTTTSSGFARRLIYRRSGTGFAFRSAFSRSSSTELIFFVVQRGSLTWGGGRTSMVGSADEYWQDVCTCRAATIQFPTATCDALLRVRRRHDNTIRRTKRRQK